MKKTTTVLYYLIAILTWPVWGPVATLVCLLLAVFYIIKFIIRFILTFLSILGKRIDEVFLKNFRDYMSL